MLGSNPSKPLTISTGDSVGEHHHQNACDFLSGGGEMGKLIRTLDWSKSGLGPVSEWPQSLKTAVGILLRSPVPIVLLWGPDGIMIYNDAYSGFAEGRHPHLFGSKVREGWPEVADFNDNVMKVGLSGGTLSYRDKELTLYRKGIPEQVWMNLDYSPVLDESGRPAGVFAVVVETTGRVRTERALARAEERLTYALEAAGIIGTFDTDFRSGMVYSDSRFATMFSVEPGKGESGLPLAEYLAGIHPDDVERVNKAIQQAVVTGEKCVLEYRVLSKDGTVRWLEVHGQCLYDESGKPWRMPGVAVDITDRKEAQERQRLLLREMNHRVKNIFAVIHGMVGLSARSARTPQEMAHSLSGRLNALLRAKELVRPEMMESGAAHNERTAIAALVRTILQPYQDGTSRERITISGPDVPVGAKAVTSLALALHESATNAVKYGALSKACGTIRVRWEAQGDDLCLEWEETGGPLIVAPPKAQGFGSVLAERSITGQLRGKIEYNWQPSGLKIKVMVPLDRLDD
jgi:two-component sensor histidine kinase